MNLLPDPSWPVILLALVLLGDAALSVRPPHFIRECLNGVGFPEQWWWALIAVKILGAAGLIAGLWIPGFAAAATFGVIAYFLLAAAAHIRARFLGSEFWLNCLGMLALSVGVLLLSCAA